MSESLRIGAPPAAPKRPRRRWPAVVAVSAAVVVIAISAAVAGIMAARADYAAPAASSNSTLGTTMNIRGGITLPMGDYALQGKACLGRGGFGDIAPGAQVKITDANGGLIGLGSITEGVVADSDDGSVRDSCLLIWRVDNVPRFQKFYGVEVSHRSIVMATEEELIGGMFTLSLG